MDKEQADKEINKDSLESVSHYQILAECSGGKLTAEDVERLEKYGQKHRRKFNATGN